MLLLDGNRQLLANGGVVSDGNLTYPTGPLAAVPEPATVTLTGLGLVALLIRTRRRRA